MLSSYIRSCYNTLRVKSFKWTTAGNSKQQHRQQQQQQIHPHARLRQCYSIISMFVIVLLSKGQINNSGNNSNDSNLELFVTYGVFEQFGQLPYMQESSDYYVCISTFVTKTIGVLCYIVMLLLLLIAAVVRKVTISRMILLAWHRYDGRRRPILLYVECNGIWYYTNDVFTCCIVSKNENGNVTWVWTDSRQHYYAFS